MIHCYSLSFLIRSTQEYIRLLFSKLKNTKMVLKFFYLFAVAAASRIPRNVDLTEKDQRSSMKTFVFEQNQTQPITWTSLNWKPKMSRLRRSENSIRKIRRNPCAKYLRRDSVKFAIHVKDNRSFYARCMKRLIEKIRQSSSASNF